MGSVMESNMDDGRFGLKYLSVSRPVDPEKSWLAVKDKGCWKRICWMSPQCRWIRGVRDDMVVAGILSPTFEGEEFILIDFSKCGISQISDLDFVE
jgi:hypothetical protein